MSELLGGIEAGGTKFVCCIGCVGEEPLATERIPTTSPGETIARVTGFFRAAEAKHGRCAAFGIASFGPLDLARGVITNTPKSGWSGADLVSPLREAFGVPIAIDTDVNGAGLAEAVLGAGRDARTLVYLTVGTGIGGGTIVDRAPLHGASHAEMGHIRVARHPGDLSFRGTCPFHGDCLEGLASGIAVEARWGATADKISYAAWDVVGFYIAQLCVSVTMIVSPDVIVIGGGLSACAELLPAVRRCTSMMLAGYPTTKQLDQFIIPPALGNRAGVLGALLLAREVLVAH